MKCKHCDNEASFFHSKCCNAHFEGVIKDGELFIVCEKCGKMVGRVTSCGSDGINKYKKGFDILIEYFDSISDEEKPKVDEQLKELGL